MKRKKSSSISIVSLVLGLTCVVLGALFVIYRFLSDREYQKQWEDYEECGLQ